MPLIEIPKDARMGKPPCGECHVGPGETCDICGAKGPELTICVCGQSHEAKTCKHDFQGWREFTDGRGGEAVCTKCGMGAMAHSLSLDF